MKIKRSLLFGLVTGIIMGWALGFLRLPFLEKNHSFWVGFITCLVVVLFIVFSLFVWNKNRLLLGLIGRKPLTSDANAINKTYTTVWVFISIFIVVGGLISSLLIYRQNKLFDAQRQYQDEKIREQANLIETMKSNNQVLLLSVFLDKIDDELKSNPDQVLSDETIARIAELCHSFKPYSSFEEERPVMNELSPERGHLLLRLARMPMDSSSFSRIKLSATFSNADLFKADLSGMDLNGVDLRKANLWGANLDRTNLNGANMKRADLRWADLNETTMKAANLNGTDLTSAELRKADLSGASFQWSKLSGAMLNEANLQACDLLGAGMEKVNLTDANLTKARLEKANLKEAILIGAELAKANVEKSWFEKLNGWQIIGGEAIPERYRIADDTSSLHKNALFCLEKMQN